MSKFTDKELKQGYREDTVAAAFAVAIWVIVWGGVAIVTVAAALLGR